MYLRSFYRSLPARNEGSWVHGGTVSISSEMSNRSFKKKTRQDPKQDHPLDTSGSSMYKRSRSNVDNKRWTKNPYKIKQLRFSRHIVNLVHKGKVSEAADVLEYMRRNRVQPDAAVYNSLISGYGKQGNLNAGFRVFNQMKKHGLLPTDHTYSSLLAACAQAGPSARPILTKIESEMERRGVRLNNIATNAHISALASCREQEDALKAYLDMIKKGTTPNLHTYSCLLQASARDRLGGMVVAQRVWQEMIASGYQPDLPSFNVLLQCLRDAGLEGTPERSCEEIIHVPAVEIPLDVEQNYSKGLGSSKHSVSVQKTGSFDVHLSADQILNVNIGLVITNTVSMEYRLRWLDQLGVNKLFKTLINLNLRPDIRLFNLLLQLVLSPSPILSYMQECQVRPDATALYTAIRVQTRLGNIVGAKTILGYSNSLGLDMGQSGYQAIASCCRRREEGLALLDEMKVAGLIPKELVFETLIKNAVRSRNYVYLTVLIKKMRHNEVLPSSSLIDILDTAASHKPKDKNHMKQRNGFKGYYQIWRENMVGTNSLDKREIEVE